VSALAYRQADFVSFDSRSESFSSESTFDPPIPAQPTVPLRQSTARWQPSDAYGVSNDRAH
jgi:hypothetical protein